MLALIVAVAHHRVIGKDNSLIWHLPNDLKFLRKKRQATLLSWDVRPLKACHFYCLIGNIG